MPQATLPDSAPLHPVLRRVPPRLRTRRALAALLLGLAVVLTGWIMVLGSVTRGQVEVRNWGIAWIGMDVLQVSALAGTALLLLRRSRLVSPTAAAAAVLLLLDAWFDVNTATGGGDWYTALAMALLVELPIALGLTALSRIALDW